MDIVLSRRAGVPIREQIAAQIDLQILSGEFLAGARLPSVRAMARRLGVHSNTVSSAYRLLEKEGRLEVRRGSGVFVRRPGPRQLREARGLDEMIRLALHVALDTYSGAEVRGAVLRWLAGAPPVRLVAIDPDQEMGELLACELREALGIPATACSLAELKERPDQLEGALGIALPYHLEAARKVVPSASVEGVTLKIPAQVREEILKLPVGAVVLLVSHSTDVLRLASVFVKSLRGDDLLVEARLAQARRRWRRVLPVADSVFADAIAFPAVARGGSRHLREVRLLTKSSVARVKSALSTVVPSRAERAQRD